MTDEFPFHEAAMVGDLEKVRKFIKEAVSVDSRDDQGRTPLHWAAEEGHDEVVDFLSGHPECDLNLKDEEGDTPVLLAAFLGEKTVVDLLLQRGAQVNCADDNKRTLLHSVSENGWTDLVQCILDWGEADPNAATSRGTTPLMLAAQREHEEVAALLIRAGANVNQSNARKETALHWAALNGRTGVVQELLEQEGLDLNSQDEKGETPLHKACLMGRREVVKQLLVAGADTTIKDTNGKTALSVGIRLEKLTLEEIRLFLQYSASFEDCDYMRISQDPDLEENVFKDVDLVTQSVVNKYQRQSLSVLKGNPNFAGKLPSTDVLKSNACPIREVENSAKCDLQTNTSCNVVKAETQPKVLRNLCKLIFLISLFLALPVAWHGSVALLAVLFIFFKLI